MAKPLNGKFNESGVIVTLNDTTGIVLEEAEDTLLYRKYKSGAVKATIELAEFDDGEAACSSDASAYYTGYGSPMTVADKMDKKAAIQKEKDRIIRFLKDVIESNDSEKSQSIDRDCKKVLEQIYYDAPISTQTVREKAKEEPLTLPLDFSVA